MFNRWGMVAYRRRWTVLIAVLVLAVIGGLWGLGVFDRMKQGGYYNESSQSAEAGRIAEQALGQRESDVVVVYDAGQGKSVDDPALATRVVDNLNALPADAVKQRVSYWETKNPALADAAKRYGLVTITLAGDDESDRLANFERVKDKLAVAGLRERIAGNTAMEHTIGERSKSDLTMAEAISLPVVLVLLLLIFGSVVAALLPVLVGGLAIAGSLGVLNALSYVVDVNNFAVNVATLLGLGLAIDYGLFAVGRFREELAEGRTTAEAVRRTVATAGRTIAFSATLLVIALAGLLVFPLDFLKSMAYGGMSAVAIAAVISLTLLPAMLGILGPKVDKLSLPWRRDKPVSDPRGLARLGRAVTKRPVVFALPILAVLLVMALPFAKVSFGAVTEKQLPSDDPTRQAIETINQNFPAAGSNTAEIVVRGSVNVDQFVLQVNEVPGVEQAVAGGGRDGVTVIHAQLAGEPVGEVARQAVDGLRALSPDLLVGGLTAEVMDANQSIVDNAPLMIGILVAATLILMFLAFGSLLLPIKAVLMSALSLSATYGVLVFVFQFGHGAAWLGITPEPLQAGMFVLIGAVVFGLSTDYETFLLSRMIEARHAGMSTPDAIQTGLVRTGRMISAAALLLIVVTGAFALSELSMMRFVGVGMIVALILDATVVRMTLVPAIMRLLGDAVWWAPQPLRRLQQKAGLSEVDTPAEKELEKV
ncbi:MMPL family transporter [Kibdelosporangium philippinense]|uniref:MMPL family transporter n=1 Tax=Kibdelosporangium philippinense TaxID=211113 RepID=A0ABS8ZC92_9PSEU|nr:MMPL family transporter [Kibdelosporangium philippinense]MCE7005117.1 MMPL family transporter [Kibdelosporangium philippinense]